MNKWPRNLGRFHLLILALGIGLIGSALAQGPRNPEERKPLKSKSRERLLEKHDENKDGVLDKSERDSINSETKKRLSERLQKYDANGNGKLDPEEAKKIKMDNRTRLEQTKSKHEFLNEKKNKKQNEDE